MRLPAQDTAWHLQHAQLLNPLQMLQRNTVALAVRSALPESPQQFGESPAMSPNEEEESAVGQTQRTRCFTWACSSA